jgi:ribosomal-protein-alanine N-acetyltransferase
MYGYIVGIPRYALCYNVFTFERGWYSILSFRLFPFKRDEFILITERLELRVVLPSSATVVTDYLSKNRVFHKPYHQLHDNTYFTVAEQREYIRSDLHRFRNRSQFSFWISYIGDRDRIIGRLSFTAIIRGALSSCLVGYHLDHDETGKGIMQEALQAGCQYMFHVQNLHRIQADIMPSNSRSVSTIERCGFKRQGLNEKYMCINGVWQDHYSYALLNEKYDAQDER